MIHACKSDPSTCGTLFNWATKCMQAAESGWLGLTWLPTSCLDGPLEEWYRLVRTNERRRDSTVRTFGEAAVLASEQDYREVIACVRERCDAQRFTE